MGADTNISWCHHTFNPVSGCAKISTGCRNCFAAALPPKMRRDAEWGEGKPRIPASESYWLAPFGWARKARAAGERHRVFLGSTMDIGEDTPQMQAVRDRALALCALTPDLDWLWLSKRLDVLARYFVDEELYQRVLRAAAWLRNKPGPDGIGKQRRGVPHIGISDPTRGLATWYPNLWVGASVEDQERADERIPHLLRVPARVRFVSAEPLLGHIQFDRVPFRPGPLNAYDGSALYVGDEGGADYAWSRRQMLDLVIGGGESGRNARPVHPDWARSLRDQCSAANVAFHWKQNGEFIHTSDTASWGPGCDKPVADYPQTPDGEGGIWLRVGKKAAGRLLDGREHNDTPEVTR